MVHKGREVKLFVLLFVEGWSMWATKGGNPLSCYVLKGEYVDHIGGKVKLNVIC